MKNKYDLEDLLKKLLSIYNNLENYKFNDDIHIIKHKNNHLNKISSEEKNKSLNFKRKIQKIDATSKYNNEDYKKNRATELALLRK